MLGWGVGWGGARGLLKREFGGLSGTSPAPPHLAVHASVHARVVLCGRQRGPGALQCRLLCQRVGPRSMPHLPPHRLLPRGHEPAPRVPCWLRVPGRLGDWPGAPVPSRDLLSPGRPGEPLPVHTMQRRHVVRQRRPHRAIWWLRCWLLLHGRQQRQRADGRDAGGVLVRHPQRGGPRLPALPQPHLQLVVPRVVAVRLCSRRARGDRGRVSAGPLLRRQLVSPDAVPPGNVCQHDWDDVGVGVPPMSLGAHLSDERHRRSEHALPGDAVLRWRRQCERDRLPPRQPLHWRQRGSRSLPGRDVPALGSSRSVPALPRIHVLRRACGDGDARALPGWVRVRAKLDPRLCRGLPNRLLLDRSRSVVRVAVHSVSPRRVLRSASAHGAHGELQRRLPVLRKRVDVDAD